MIAWQYFWQQLQPLAKVGDIELPTVLEDYTHNAHMSSLKTSGLGERTDLLEHIKTWCILALIHYVPCQSSKAGSYFGLFLDRNRFTTLRSKRLIRLPMWSGSSKSEQTSVIDGIKEFYE